MLHNVTDRVMEGSCGRGAPARPRRRGSMRRLLSIAVTSVAGLVLLAVPLGGPSIEQMFVAQTQAASDSHAACTMPPLPPVSDAHGQEPRLAIPTSSNQGGDLPPVRMVVDPYPS